MMTIERKRLTSSDGGFDFEAAKTIIKNDDAVYKAYVDFYEDDNDVIEIDETYKQAPPLDSEYESHRNDYRYSEDMLEFFETPGGYYDRDTGCFCIPAPRRRPKS